MFATLILGAGVCGLLLVSTLSSAESANKLVSTVAELNPFMHFAYIPEDADQSSIRFEKARMVVVPTRIRYSYDASACAELAFRDSSGATGCPNLHTEASAEAYEVTYSFSGPPLASDESGNTHFTFHVYFRPNELGPDVRQLLSANKKHNRADVAGSFAVSARHEDVQSVTRDETKSQLCGGSFVDGNWSQYDGNCRDKSIYKIVAGLANVITVRVDPSGLRSAALASKASTLRSAKTRQ
jgi:hypothetical protein